MVLLSVCGSITINAESPYTYTYYVTLANGTNQIWKSDKEISNAVATGSYYYDPNTGMYIERAAPTRAVYRSELTANACILSWNGEEWVISLPVITCNANVDTMYHTVFCYNAVNSVTTNMPSGFPDYNDMTLEEIVDGITTDKISSALDQTESEIADSILEQTQAIIDTLTGVDINTDTFYQMQDLTLSIVMQYYSLSDPTMMDGEFLNLLSEMYSILHMLKNNNKQEFSVTDVLVLNNIYEMVTNLIGQVQQNRREEDYWDDRDIDESTSDGMQQSDKEEVDYLNELIAETEKSISEISPAKDFTTAQVMVATQIVDGIWENPIIKKLIPVAACFMVVCVVLGVKYRL